MNAVLAAAARLERVRRPRDLDLLGVLRVRRARRAGPARAVDRVRARRARRSSTPSGRRRAAARRRRSPTRAALSSDGVERDRIEDPDHGEPALAEPHAHAGRGRSRAARRPRRRARPPGSGRSPRRGTARAPGVAPTVRRQRRVGGRDGDAAGLGRVDEVVAAHGRRSISLIEARRLDAVRAPDHRSGGLRQRGVLAHERLAGRHAQEVGAEPVELREQVGSGGLRDAQHRDHRGDPDRDAQARQGGAQPPRAQADRAGPEHVAGSEPAGSDPLRRRSSRPPTTLPSRSSTRRGRAAAISRSWVITTIVAPSPWSSRSRAMIPAPAWLSRLPVGSSANTIDGRATSARAIATRWRSPPESLAGGWSSRCAEPDAIEHGPCARSPLGDRQPRVHQAGGDVLDRRQPVEQEELLEHEADLARAQAGQLAVAERGDVVAGHARAARSSAARAFP